jgi:hypothetical protein
MVLFWTWISAIKARRDADEKVRAAALDRPATDDLASFAAQAHRAEKVTFKDTAVALVPRVQRAAQARIFISYRREGDAALAGRIADRLGNEFGSGHVFMDVDAMRLGFDFVEIINEEVAKCDVLLAVIGSRWLELLDTNKTNPTDFVRIEIAAALKRKIPVIPILVDGTKIPPGDRLPEELQGLERRHALDLRNQSFRADMDRLVRELKTSKGS